jgi:hypothetical protein
VDTLKYSWVFRRGQLIKLRQPPERIVDPLLPGTGWRRRRLPFRLAYFVFHVWNATVCWRAQCAVSASEHDRKDEVTMATAEECRKALDALIGRLAELDPQTRASKLADRTLSCRVTDLNVTFATRIGPHGADPLTEVQPGAPRAQIRFSAKSDDVVAISADPGSMLKAWVTGRIKVEGSVLDLLNLRKLL